VKRDSIRLSPTTTVETYRDLNGRAYIAFSGGASVFIRGVAELRRFLKIPKGIPMRESLESWLASLADQDAKRKGAVEAPVGDANVEGSWDPQAHDDDPTANTRTII
jgi:hypothetical protein